MSQSTRNYIEINSIDHRIALAGGQTVATERLPQNIQHAKASPNPMQRIAELSRENGRLRQEVCHAREQAQAYLTLHHKALEALQLLQEATQVTSDRLIDADTCLMRYFGVQVEETAQKDFIVL